MKTMTQAFALAFSLLASFGSLHAAILVDTMNVDNLISGSAPASAVTPWLQATFIKNTLTPNQMTLTLSAPNLTNSLVDETVVGEAVRTWFFNYAGNMANLTITNTGGIAPAVILPAQNLLATPWGSFDFEMIFFPASFLNGNSSTFTLSDPNGIGFSDFNVPSTGPNGLITLAQVDSIPAGLGAGLAYLTTTPLAAPEPMTYASLATLLALVAVCARRRVQES